MHTAVRPYRRYMTAGTAVVGASVIAVAPIAPPPADIRVPAAPVQLATPVEPTALVNPLEVFGEVLFGTLENAGALAGEIANPGPILELIATQAASLANPAAVLEFFTNLTDPAGVLANANDLVAGVTELLDNTLTALTGPGVQGLVEQVIQAVQDGDLSFALSRTLVTIPLTVLLPSVGLIPQIGESLGNLVPPVRDLVTTLTGTEFLLGVGFPALDTVFTTATVIGNAADDLIAAVQAGDLEGVVNAVVTGTATVIDAVQTALLSPTEGLPAALLGAIDILGQPSTTSTAMAEANAVPESAATAVTVDVPEAVADGTTELDTDTLAAADADSTAATSGTESAAATSNSEADVIAQAENATKAETAAADEATSGTAKADTASEEAETGGPYGENAGTGNGDGNGKTDLSDGNKAEPGSDGASARNNSDTSTKTGSDQQSGASDTATGDGATTGSSGGSSTGSSGSSGSSGSGGSSSGSGGNSS